MISMTCKQVGSFFLANMFDEIAQLRQSHRKEMFQINDQSHINAMNEMSKLMQNTDTMNQ